MRNNNGFGKFEVLTVILLLLCIFGFLMYTILGGASKQKIDTMKKSAISLSKTVAINGDSFHSVDVVYLDEVIHENLLKNISSPFSSKDCDVGESKVEMIEGHPYVTLKCDAYLIDKELMESNEDAKIYKVSDWSEEKLEGDDVETKKLYNCKEKGKEVFDKYYEELYFVFEVNKKYGSDHYFANEVEECKVVSKKFYRTKKLVN